jgi:intein/homing endonuclease
MKNKIDWGNDEEFIAKYTELKSSRKMAEVYKCDKSSVLNHAKEIEFNPNSINREYKLSMDDKANIVNAYYTKSSQELADEYNVTRGMITKLWYDAGLNGKEVRTYKIDHQDFFSVIDTEEKAYWLGFIMADGCIHDFNDHRSSTLAIGLSSEDKEHIEKFLKAIGTNKPIYQHCRNGKDYVSMQVSSSKLTTDLKNLGCVPKKTLLNTWVDLCNDELQFAFIRGYFDGDGSIASTFEINTLHRVHISIAGYKKTLECFMHFLDSHGVKSRFQKDNRSNKYSSTEEFGNLIINNKQAALSGPLGHVCHLLRKRFSNHLRTGSSYSFRQRRARRMLDTTTSSTTPWHSCNV